MVVQFVAAEARGRRGRGILLLVLMTAGFSARLAAEAPFSVARARAARERLVEAARSYEGSPYLFGGTDRAGFDCSGLVYRISLQVLGLAPPRTARELAGFCEPLRREDIEPGDLLFFDTSGRLSHVGVYAGEGVFIHSASEGPRTGVIESSITEKYWGSAYAGAGRLLPRAGYLGITVAASAGPGFGTGIELRSAWTSICASYRLAGLEPGLDLRPEYDAGLGVLRLPVALSLGLDRRLRFFAGPALTIGTPMAEGGRLEASGGMLATAGLSWTPLAFRVRGGSLGLCGELEYNRYVDAAGEGAGLGSSLRIGLGLSLRKGF